MPFRELDPLAGMLGVEMGRQAGAEKEGMLAVFGAQSVDRLIEASPENRRILYGGAV
jgi:hypothetical protein